LFLFTPRLAQDSQVRPKQGGGLTASFGAMGRIYCLAAAGHTSRPSLR